MHKPYEQRQPLGLARIEYDRTGKAIHARFEPAVRDLDSVAVETLLCERVPDTLPRDPDTAIKQAERVLADWFLGLDRLEVSDREESRIESSLVKCETWPDGTPRICEVQFFWATTEVAS